MSDDTESVPCADARATKRSQRFSPQKSSLSSSFTLSLTLSIYIYIYIYISQTHSLSLPRRTVLITRAHTHLPTHNAHFFSLCFFTSRTALTSLLLHANTMTSALHFKFKLHSEMVAYCKHASFDLYNLICERQFCFCCLQLHRVVRHDMIHSARWATCMHVARIQGILVIPSEPTL